MVTFDRSCDCGADVLGSMCYSVTENHLTLYFYLLQKKRHWIQIAIQFKVKKTIKHRQNKLFIDIFIQHIFILYYLIFSIAQYTQISSTTVDSSGF